MMTQKKKRHLVDIRILYMEASIVLSRFNKNKAADKFRTAKKIKCFFQTNTERTNMGVLQCEIANVW